ncbi:MAG: BstXI family restriction endonuclease, partial [Dolichospermum sp.]
FFSRLEQAEGRKVPDLTVTQINLFHIEELKYGAYNHRPYNLGWGHHHCNVVVKDSGITETIEWMYRVVKVNIDNGYFTPENKSS